MQQRKATNLAKKRKAKYQRPLKVAQKTDTKADNALQHGVAGIYNAAALYYAEDTSPARRFSAFKDAVLSANAVIFEENLDIKSKHELEMMLMRSTLAGVNSKDRSLLQAQLDIYHLEQVVKYPAIDPILSLDILIQRCDQANLTKRGSNVNLRGQEQALAFFNAFDQDIKELSTKLDPSKAIG